MDFLPDNCIRNIKCPLGDIDFFDYNVDLNLIASFRYGGHSVDLWNPDTGEVVAGINTAGYQDDVLFLQGNYVAVLWTKMDFSPSSLMIYSISPLKKVSEITMPFTLSVPKIALTPQNNLLVSAGGIVEMDLKMEEQNKKCDYQFNKNLYLGLSSIHCMCCSRSNYDVCISEGHPGTLKCLHVEPNTSDETGVICGEAITCCYINGEEMEFGCIRSIVHDGENVIVATENEIIALETATEGSIGHVIVSTSFPTDHWGTTQIGKIVVYNNHLMISNGSDTIKVYYYKTQSTLKSLCRQQINMVLKCREEQVDFLPIPSTMKDYLLYKF